MARTGQNIFPHRRCFSLFFFPSVSLLFPFCLSFLFPLATSFYTLLSLTSPSPFLKGIKVVTQMITQTRVAMETQSCDWSRHAQTTTKRRIRENQHLERAVARLTGTSVHFTQIQPDFLKNRWAAQSRKEEKKKHSSEKLTQERL